MKMVCTPPNPIRARLSQSRTLDRQMRCEEEKLPPQQQREAGDVNDSFKTAGEGWGRFSARAQQCVTRRSGRQAGRQASDASLI